MEKRFRSASSFGRPAKGTVAPYDRVLIVCEGKKTEPNYLKGVRDFLRLSNSNVEVTGECGSDPSSVVAKAKELKKADAGYDKIFCVFDRDKHERFAEAVQEATTSRFISVVSIPCFEVWVLLHFAFTSKPYAASKGKSICDRVIKDVRSLNGLAAYQKGDKTLFSVLKDRLGDAMANAQRLRTQNQKNGSQNPSTDMDELVGYLFSLKLTGCKLGGKTKVCAAHAKPNDPIQSCLACPRR